MDNLKVCSFFLIKLQSFVACFLKLAIFLTVQLLIPMIGTTVVEMVNKWAAMSSATVRGEVEIDVADWFQGVTEDAITRTAFGRSYDDGKAVFRLQAQQMIVAAEAFRVILVPGYR